MLLSDLINDASAAIKGRPVFLGIPLEQQHDPHGNLSARSVVLSVSHGDYEAHAHDLLDFLENNARRYGYIFDGAFTDAEAILNPA